MKTVAKYNLFKGISTILTVGTPIISLLSCSTFFIHRPDTAISATGIFTILICILLLKDKIAENLKMPSAFIVSTVVFVLLLLVEKIILPMKIVAICTMITSGVDELTFKQVYKKIEQHFPESVQDYKHIGFIFTTTNTLLKEKEDECRTNSTNDTK